MMSPPPRPIWMARAFRRACSNIPDCSYGVDGLRFNPHQQPANDFVHAFAWGYRVVVLGSYENVLPNVGIHPTLIFSQDVQGTAPGPGGNFVAGRKQAQLSLEMRYRADLSRRLFRKVSDGVSPKR